MWSVNQNSDLLYVLSLPLHISQWLIYFQIASGRYACQSWLFLSLFSWCQISRGPFDMWRKEWLRRLLSRSDFLTPGIMFEYLTNSFCTEIKESLKHPKCLCFSRWYLLYVPDHTWSWKHSLLEWYIPLCMNLQHCYIFWSSEIICQLFLFPIWYMYHRCYH